MSASLNKAECREVLKAIREYTNQLMTFHDNFHSGMMSDDSMGEEQKSIEVLRRVCSKLNWELDGMNSSEYKPSNGVHQYKGYVVEHMVKEDGRSWWNILDNDKFCGSTRTYKEAKTLIDTKTVY